MIELDDTKQQHFLSDEARSGFGDDNESFSLGRLSGNEAVNKENLTDNLTSLPPFGTPIEGVIENNPVSGQTVQTLESVQKENFESTTVTLDEPADALQSELPEIDLLRTPLIPDGKVVPEHTQPEHIQNDYSTSPSAHENMYHTTSITETPKDTANNNTLTAETATIVSNFDTPSSDTATIHPDSSGAEVFLGASPNTIPTAHEAYVPPMATYATLDTIISENASIDGTRRVITIPSAEEQRKADAEKSAHQTTPTTNIRKNSWSNGAMAVSVAALILAALVASGYMLVRKTTLGSSAQNLWSAITGERSKPTMVDSSSGTLLDLTKKSQDKNSQNTNNNASGALNAQDSMTITAPSANTQSTNISQTQQQGTPQEAHSAPNTARNKPQGNTNTTIHKNLGNGDASNTISTPATGAQPAKAQQQQEKSLLPQTNQTNAPKANQPSNAKQTNSKPTSAQATNQKSIRPVASALERQKTQQISGVFAIQVYATPSIADAEDWVERLKQRGMVNTMVTSQVVRGQTMYRVRFGLYHSLQEAERDAARFGYVGSWVVRLR